MSFLRDMLDKAELNEISDKKYQLKHDVAEMQHLGSLNEEQKMRVKAEYRELCRREYELKNK